MTDKEKLDPTVQGQSAEEIEPSELTDQEIENEIEREIQDQDNMDKPYEGTSAAAAPKRSGLGWLLLSLVLAVLLVIALIRPPFGGGNETVATVNGEKISKDRLYDKIVKPYGGQALDALITQTLVDQELKKANIEVTQADYDKELAAIKADFPSEEEFNAALKQYNMTLEDLQENVVQPQVKLKKLLGPKAEVTDEEVKNFFEQNQASFDTQEQVRASHILVETKEEAEAIKKQLEGGADFAEIAKAKSLDPNSKEAGGDLNFFPRGVMEKAFEDAAFSQKKDALGIAKTSRGFHVIKVTDRKEAKKATLEEKKAEIKDQLIGQKVQDLSGPYMEELKAKAKITNTLADKTDAETAPEVETQQTEQQ